MSSLALVVILVVCALVALAITAPFVYLARRRQRSRPAATDSLVARRLGPFEILLYSIGVAAFFWALAQQHVDPDGFIGARMKTAEGRFWFGVMLTLILSILDYICRAIFSRWRRHRTRTRLPDARKDTDTRDGV